jgi:hypothetical protein
MPPGDPMGERNRVTLTADSQAMQPANPAAAPQRGSSTSARPGWALPLMAVALGGYVVLHSPLRELVARLGGLSSRVCYFVCPPLPVDASGGMRVLAAWLLIAVVLLASWALADRFGGAPDEWPIAFGVIGLALVAVPAATLGEIAALTHTTLLRPPWGPLLALTPAAAVTAAAWRRGWRPHPPRLALGTLDRLHWLVLGLGAALLLGSVVINLAHPATGGDGLSYHAPLAVFLWEDGDLVTFLNRAPDTFALANPGTAELWYGLLRVAGGERLANFGQLPFALLGLAAILAFSRRLGSGRGAALLSALAFLLCPIVVMQVGMQPTDVLGAAVLMAAVALASAPVVEWDRRRLALLGLAFGLTATTRLALLPSLAGVGAFVAAGLVRRAAPRRRAAVLKQLALVAACFLLVAGPWWCRNLLRYGNPVYPAAIPLLGRGITVSDFGYVDKEFVPTPAAWPLYPLIEPQDDRSGFGAVFAVAVIPGLLYSLYRAKRAPLAVYGASLVFMVPAWWFLTMHEPRFFLAHAGLGLAFVPWSLAAVPRRQRGYGRWLLGAAAVYSTLVTVDQALFPFARQPADRLRFYDRVWGVDPMVAALPEAEGLLHNTGYAPGLQEYAAYYPLLGPSQSRRVLPVDTEGTTAVLVERMRAAGVRLAYVAAAPQFYATVERLYDPTRFELLHVSAIDRGEKSGARRYLYEAVPDTSEHRGIRRYLFLLRDISWAGANGTKAR